MLTQIRKKILQKDVKKYYGYNGIGSEYWWNLDTISYTRDHSHLGNQRYSKKKISKLFEKSKLSILVPYCYIFGETYNLIPCPSGSFIKGHEQLGDNLPQEIKIEKSFLLGETEITQGVYEFIMNGKNPSCFKYWKNPIENVSWYDAVMFCNELSKSLGLDTYYTIGDAQDIMTERDWSRRTHYPIETNANSKGFRLPTEWEWEYAAKAGTQLEYSGSDDPKEVAWYDKNSKKTTHPVKQKNPNAWGFYDMTGNVSEWCENKYNPNNTDISAYRVNRGGGWYNNALDLSSALRYINSPSLRSCGVGFRVCRYI